MLFAHEGAVTALSLSEHCGAVVSCGADSTLVISALPELTFVRRVLLDFVGAQLAVTRNWGCAAVAGGRQIRVFSLDGDALGSADLGAPITQLCAVASPPGADFVAAALEGGRVLLCPPQRPAESTVLLEMPGITRLHWSEANTALAVGGDSCPLLLLQLRTAVLSQT
jgi:hypothetical protein